MAADRLDGVISAMRLIRPLLAAAGCDVTPWTDREIAETMLECCPEPTDWWLSLKHLRQSFERLKAKGMSSR